MAMVPATVGIGGIMGGSETEIPSPLKTSLIECAWFDPIAIRRAARSSKLHTEASTRFGRGADPEMAEARLSPCRRTHLATCRRRTTERSRGRNTPVSALPRKSRSPVRNFSASWAPIFPTRIWKPSSLHSALPLSASTKIVAPRIRFSRPGNVRNPPGAPTSNARSISSRRWLAFTARTNFLPACPPPASARLACPIRKRKRACANA